MSEPKESARRSPRPIGEKPESDATTAPNPVASEAASTPPRPSMPERAQGHPAPPPLRPRVLMFSWEYPPYLVGGIGKHVDELLPALVAEGVTVDLVTPALRGGAAEETVAADERSGATAQVVRVPVSALDPSDFYGSVARSNLDLEAAARDLWGARGPYDVIHVHDWLVGDSGIAMKHAAKTPLLATIHATEFGRWRGWIGNDLSRSIDAAEWRLSYESWRVITCSDFMRAEVQTALRAPPDKLDVIPNGVDTSRFDALDGEDLTDFRARFALPDESIVFTVGRVVHEKGAHLLVEAMPRVRFTHPRAKLVVAGTGPNLAYAQRRADELGVSENCLFTGFIPDADRDRLFKIAEVAAFPSLYEPFGIVALEAMAAKTPVLVSQVGGLAEVVQHDETGVTVYPDDVGSLTWGLNYSLDDPERARERAARAYALVRDRYNWGAIARQTRADYERLIAERAGTVWA